MENKFDKKIKVFEEEYNFDTLQERKLALRDFAEEIEKEILRILEGLQDKYINLSQKEGLVYKPCVYEGMAIGISEAIGELKRTD